MDQIRFDDSFVRTLPPDPELRNYTRKISNACYSHVKPTPVAAPVVVAHSSEMAARLGLAPSDVSTERFASVFGGNALIPGMQPYAQCYGGHQFGNWAGQLGDGRAITLGEVLNDDGERWEIQLKGAGPTPYSRRADGRAVMRSSVREFLCSEAMHHLGIPTTRALSLVSTGDLVVRDMMYDGNPRPEPGAIVCRASPSFLRFGSFEILAFRREADLMRQLLDYTIETHFPELGAPCKDVYLAWLGEVVKRTARLVVEWMRVGFVHGVMNTDNMSVLGLTIDYGPYGWLDNFDPDWTPNTTDANGRRYRFGHQPHVALWNLVRLAESLILVTEDPHGLEAALDLYNVELNRAQQAMMCGKLGLSEFRPEQDKLLIEDLFEVLQRTETDMTIFYRRLADLSAVDSDSDETLVGHFESAYYDLDDAATHRKPIARWLRRYLDRVAADERSVDARRTAMNAVNPKFVLRNYVAQLAIDKAEQGDGSLVSTLLEVLRRPYDEQPEHDEYGAKRPEWARNRPGCSMLSCSS